MSQQQSYYQYREQSSSLQVKRSLFHSTIRKQQLDKYKDKKRQQYFGYTLKKGDSEFLKQESRNEKRKIENFMIQIWAKKLNGQNYSLQVINEVACELDKMDLRNLTNNQIYMNKEFEFTVQLLWSMLGAWIKQEGYSKQVTFPLFNSLKQILSSLIHKQQSQFSQTLKNKRTKTYLNRILQGKVVQTRNVNLLEIQRQLKDIQRQEQSLVMHPIEGCWLQVKGIAESLGELSIIQCRQQSGHNNNITTNTNNELLHQCQQLLSITSLISHPHYTKPLLQIFLTTLTSLQYLPEQIIDTIISSLHNFVSTQNKTSKDNEKIIITYDTQSLVMITRCFSMIMNSFVLSTQSSNNIVKAMLHLFYTHQQTYMHIFLNSHILKQLLQPYEKQRQENFNLWVMLESEQIKPEQFIDMYVQQQTMEKHQKTDLLHLIGVVFNYVSTNNYLKQTLNYLPIVIELVHYQIKQLGKINSAKQSIFTDSKKFNEEIPIEDYQDIVEYALFVLRNLLGVCVDVTNGFIERNGLADLLNVWQYMAWLEDIVGKNTNSGSFSMKKIDQARRIKLIIIDCVYNMTTMLTSQHSNLQSLQIFIEYKHSSMIKLLLHHMKSLTYNQDLLYFSQQKQCLGYALLALTKLLRFVVCDGYSTNLVDDLEHSGGEFGCDMMKDVLTLIMMGEEVYGRDVSSMAVKCLELVDEMLKSAEWGNHQNTNQLEQYQHIQNYQNSKINLSQDQQFEI